MIQEHLKKSPLNFPLSRQFYISKSDLKWPKHYFELSTLINFLISEKLKLKSIRNIVG
jgi:hypothetical protein